MEYVRVHYTILVTLCKFEIISKKAKRTAYPNLAFLNENPFTKQDNQ